MIINIRVQQIPILLDNFINGVSVRVIADRNYPDFQFFHGGHALRKKSLQGAPGGADEGLCCRRHRFMHVFEFATVAQENFGRPGNEVEYLLNNLLGMNELFYVGRKPKGRCGRCPRRLGPGKRHLDYMTRPTLLSVVRCRRLSMFPEPQSESITLGS
ncbi:hypothetical protein EVAR_14396_1 [Eumeta japonica]|uniref:Uncharacterized protein n=1 Tax=Eumeta variegata TaxID=151549 RepID=A0A4C1TYF5_EUMVA|nr:hypothetical protein EVAR_14396_1 [Eumeta japonica]